MSRFESLESRQMLSITVNTLVDENNGIGVGGVSLREAIAAAPSYGNQVEFSPSLNGGTIALTVGHLTIAQDIEIIGPGADLLTVDASLLDPTPTNNNLDGGRAFFIWGASVDATLSGLTLTGGDANGGGGGHLQ